MKSAGRDKMSRELQHWRMSKVRVPDKQRAKHRKQMGGLLKAARISAGVDPQDAAKRLGVPTNTYLSWERGRTSMPLYLIEPFCELTHSSPGFLITGKGSQYWGSEGTETGTFRTLKPKKPK